ncbi:MAG: SurA N-terminal domain-containing protein, partial [Casimicrobiaceae bacterium]
MKSMPLQFFRALGLWCAFAFTTAAIAQMQMPAMPTPAPAGATNAAAPAVPAPRARSKEPEVPLDRVVAVVNDEAITQYDIDESRAKTIRQLNASKVPVPPKDVLDKQVLERLINERALMQFAKESG